MLKCRKACCTSAKPTSNERRVAHPRPLVDNRCAVPELPTASPRRLPYGPDAPYGLVQLIEKIDGKRTASRFARVRSFIAPAPTMWSMAH